MTEPLRILAIYAHPDDEIGVGGILAKYAFAGADITLACATRGEAATIYCDSCATRETLAAVRTAELACCCRELGIGRLEWLDWPDGGVQTVPEPVAAAQLVSLIRRLRPHILLTHPEHGTYPHPDHIGVHERVFAAYHAAADPEFDPESGPAWATPKLYVRAMPESTFDLIPGFRDYRVSLNGQSLPFVADSEEDIDCVIDCTDTVDRRIAGWKCHISQHNPNGTFSQLPDDMQRRIFGVEHLRLFAQRLPADLPRHDCLEAGLPAFSHV